MSRYLITGGAGFIGSQLAYRLLKNGEEICLVDNFSYGREDNLQFADADLSPYVVRADIRDRDAMDRVFREFKPEYVFNIAGIAPLPDCQSDPMEAESVNVGGFIHVLHFSRLYGVKSVVQASTNAMYENVTTFPTFENFEEEGIRNRNLDEVLPTLIYPSTKYCAEQFARSFVKSYGMNVGCVRFANVYGPHVDCLRKQPPFVAYMVRELYYGRTPVFHSDGNQKRDYIYVDDLVNLLLKVSKQVNGFDAVNCATGLSYSVRELYNLAQTIMKKDIPAQYADDAHYWRSYPALYEGAYPIKIDVLSHEIRKYTCCGIRHAFFEYGWQPETDIIEGMKKLIEAEVKLLKEKDAAETK